MTANRRLLFTALILIGAISGFALGELFLGRGMGIYVAPLSALVGLVLAWALWSTRPRRTDVADVAEEPPEPPARRMARQAGKVRVTKPQQGGKQR